MGRVCLVCVTCLLFACGTEAGDSSDSDVGTSSSTEAQMSSASASVDASTNTGDAPSQPGETSSTGHTDSTGTDKSPPGSSSGDETTDGALPPGQWAMTEITYTEGGTTETLTVQDRAFCDATLDSGRLLLRYQQAQGFTVWTVNIPAASGAGDHTLTQDFSGVYMNINEVSDDWMAYFDPSMALGTLELTDAQIEDGGVAAGTLTASLTSNDGNTTAEFSATFYAELP